MRVYLPATPAILADLARTGELGPAPLRGYAVTAAVQEEYSESDEEELEYLATSLAADDSFQLVKDLARPAARRVVIAAEVPDAQVKESGEVTGAVVLDLAVALAAVAAFHVDDPDFALDPADPEGAADQELLWYAAQELGDLLEP